MSKTDPSTAPPSPASEEELLSMGQVAERLQKKEWFVRKLVRQGLPCIKLSDRATWFVWSEVTQWLRTRSAAVKQLKQTSAGLNVDRWH